MRTILTILILILILALCSSTFAKAILQERSKAPYRCTFKLFSDADDVGYCEYADAPEEYFTDDRQVPCKGGRFKCTTEGGWQGCSFKIDKKTKKPVGKAKCGLPS